MSDFPPGSSTAANAKSPAYADALLRARQIASKIKPESGPSTTPSLTAGVKRPLEDSFAIGDGPDNKKSAAINDPFGAQLAARAAGNNPGATGTMEGVMNNDAGSGPQGPPGNGAPQGPQSSEIVMVPDKMVGLIIGRGGEQITRLQAETGCKIQMAADSQGMPERQCTLTGTPQAIAEAKVSIDRIISNEGNGPPRGPNFNAPSGAGGSMFEMMVPGHKVGLIIGKAGETIKQLQEQSGAKIVIIQDSPEAANEKPLRITGAPENVEAAKQLVIDIVNQGDDRDMGFAGRGRGRGRGRGGFDRGRGGRGGGRGGYGQPQWGGSPNGGPGGNDYGSGGQFTDYVAVPSNKCGLIIGKGGETIKSINQQTGAHCEVDRNAPPDARDKNFVIRGTQEQVERAKQMILEKIGMPGPGGGGGGYGGPSNYGSGGQPSSWGGQYQQGGYQPEPSAAAPQAGQADYSQQWAEYYRSMGMIKEAEAIEMRNRGAPAQPAAAAPAPAAPANGAAAPNGASGAADYSAQWAEYYRSVGKHKEAEAIEAQIKQKAAVSAPQAYPNAQYGYSYQNQGAVPGAPQPTSGYAGYTGYSAYGAQPGAPE